MTSEQAWTRVGGVFLTLGLTGCAAAPRPSRSVAWEGVADGETLLTPHYALHTDAADVVWRRELVRTMERAHAQYEALSGAAQAPAGEAPGRLDGYVFGDRQEWADYTRRTAGPVADVYLLIRRGGYAHGRAFATFYFGGPQTLEVCRHEGFHQYVAASFRRRPPPFLEEGLATLFEAGFDGDDLARPIKGGTRHLKLVAARRAGRLLPLPRLLTMNAGDVADTDAARIATFYAQAWALAHLLARDRRYRDGLRSLLRAYAAGAEGSDAELFQKHLGVAPAALAGDFEAYQRVLAGAG